MNKTIDVKRPTYSQDASFGQSTTMTTVYDDVPASIQPASGTDLVMYAQRLLKITHSIFVDTAIVVKTGDIINDGTNSFTVVGFEDLIRLQRVYKIDCALYMNA